MLEVFEWDSANPMQWCRSTGIPRVGYLWKYLDELLTIERFDTIAAGVQAFVEYFLVEWVRRCIRETGLSRLAVSGGTFMNVKANQAILSLPEVDELFVFPSCGDETNSVGAAYWYYANQKLSANERVDIDSVGSIYWGGEFHDNDIESILDTYNFTTKDVRWEKYDDVEGEVAELLAAGQVVARFKGRMEFGARALGNRSILANASQPNVVRYINDIIKSRDFWMPFAPSVLADYSADYFHKPKSAKACYMVMSFDTISNKRNSIFAAVHPQDGTARPQEVYPDDNPEYELLLRKYQSISGDGAIPNTSFNLHGYPLVYSPDDGKTNSSSTSGSDKIAWLALTFIKVPPLTAKRDKPVSRIQRLTHSTKKYSTNACTPAAIVSKRSIVSNSSKYFHKYPTRGMPVLLHHCIGFAESHSNTSNIP
jgi:carbamoyltransferase